MSIPDYTPHFAVVGGPAPHPAGDGRVGVVLVASKALKQVELEEEVVEHPPWSLFRELPPEYKTTIKVTLDHRIKTGYQYTVFWAQNYSEAFEALFNDWGQDIIPDNQAELEFDKRRELM